MEKDNNNVFEIEKVLSEAETIMYSEKQKYYEENNISHHR